MSPNSDACYRQRSYAWFLGSQLIENLYVIVISIDFSKVFDTVHHSTLLDKMAHLDMPDEVYNWLVSFFSGHLHCTRYRGNISTASVIQGSSIGSASYVVNTGDLQAVTPGNLLIRFADDTYIIIPAANANSRQSELDNVELWSLANNLKVNPAKCTEIFVNNRRKTAVQLPLPVPNITCITTMKVLGVTLTNSLSVAEHLQAVISSCAQTLYALRMLRAHGMDDTDRQTVYQSLVIAKLTH